MLEYLELALAWLRQHPLLVAALVFFLWNRWRNSGPMPKGPEGHKVAEVKGLGNLRRVLARDMPAAGKKVMVLDCFATWCPPCRAAAPVFAEMSMESEMEKVQFASVNVDESPDVSKELGITAMPTFKLLKPVGERGEYEVVGEQRGWSQDAVRKMIADAL